MAWLQDWGNAFYPVAFLWAFFEGETFVIFGGWGAHEGIIDLPLLIAVVWIGSFLGDQVYFWLGRKWGAKALARFPAAEVPAAKALGWLERWGVGFILLFRFLYGVRNVASVAIGTTSMRWRKFLFWNFLAAGIWACSFAGAGYMFGEAAASVGEYGPKLLLGLAIVAALTFVARKWFGWKRRRRAAAMDAPPAGDAATPPPSDPVPAPVYTRESIVDDTQRLGRIVPPRLDNRFGQALAD